MFDFTSSKLLLLGIVALLVIGPKDLPALLRTIGKYMGIIRRHASDFRAQFDEAMRESELDELKKQVESIQRDTEETIRAAERDVQAEMDSASSSVDAAIEDQSAAAAALPVANAGGAGGTSAPLNGAAHPEPEPAATDEGAAKAPEKSGA